MLSQPSNSHGAYTSVERHGLKGRGFYLVKIFGCSCSISEIVKGTPARHPPGLGHSNLNLSSEGS